MAQRGVFRRLGDALFGGQGGPSTSKALNAGGVRNLETGLGGPADKTEGTFFVPHVLTVRDVIQTVYVQSWVAARFVDMPIDDMWVRGRTFTDDDESKVQQFEDAWNDSGAERAITAAAKSARLYGTGFAIIMSTEASLETPLDTTRIREGDVKSFLTLDRFDCSFTERVTDPFDPDYNLPSIYRFQPRSFEGQLIVHPSRVIRFDGKRSLNSDGWSGAYDRDWGISELLCAITEITQDSSLFAAMSHLAQEASMLVVKTPAFTDTIMGQQQGPDEPSLQDIGHAMNLYKSVFRTVFADTADEFERITVNIAGWDKILEKAGERMAAIAGIPATRFLSRAPAGMNATGESDMKNYAMHVASMQARLMDKPVRLLDEIVMRNAGMAPAEDSAPMPYRWLPLIEMGDKEKAEAAKIWAEALKIGYDAAALDENEFRERLSENEMFGELPELSDEEVEARNAIPVDPNKVPPGGNGPPGSGNAPQGGSGGPGGGNGSGGG